MHSASTTLKFAPGHMAALESAKRQVLSTRGTVALNATANVLTSSSSHRFSFPQELSSTLSGMDAVRLQPITRQPTSPVAYRTPEIIVPFSRGKTKLHCNPKPVACQTELSLGATSSNNVEQPVTYSAVRCSILGRYTVGSPPHGRGHIMLGSTTVCRARQKMLRKRRDTVESETEAAANEEESGSGSEENDSFVDAPTLSDPSPATKGSQPVNSQRLTEQEMDQVRADVSRRIRQFAKDGDLAGAVEAFTEMQVMGVGPDVMAATALIDCCVRCGEIARAERAFSSLFPSPSGSSQQQQSPAPKPTLEPDAVVVGVLLRAYGRRKPPQWSKIQQLLSRMEADFGLPPSAAIFNELVDICARDNEVARGMQVLERMAQSGVEPDEFTFAAVKRRKALRSHFKKLFLV